MNDDSTNQIPLRGLFALGCRLIAVVFLLRSFVILPYVLFRTVRLGLTKISYSQYHALVVTGLSIILPLFLLLYADWFARKIISDSTNEDIFLETNTTRQLLISGALLSGLLFVLRSLPDTISKFFDWFVNYQNVTFQSIEVFTKLVLGVGLLTGATFLTDILLDWHRKESFTWDQLKCPPWMAVFIVLIVFLFVLMLNSI